MKRAGKPLADDVFSMICPFLPTTREFHHGATETQSRVRPATKLEIRKWIRIHRLSHGYLVAFLQSGTSLRARLRAPVSPWLLSLWICGPARPAEGGAQNHPICVHDENHWRMRPAISSGGASSSPTAAWQASASDAPSRSAQRMRNAGGSSRL